MEATKEINRIESLDVLRGFALLGILLINIFKQLKILKNVTRLATRKDLQSYRFKKCILRKFISFKGPLCFIKPSRVSIVKLSPKKL